MDFRPFKKRAKVFVFVKIEKDLACFSFYAEKQRKLLEISNLEKPGK
jgi:hypothetical protein